MLLVGEQLNGDEILDFMPEESEPAEEVFLADTSRSQKQDSSRLEPKTWPGDKCSPFA